MPATLLDALLPARTLFVVGKGGVGKSTTAAAIALAFADRGEDVRLLSVDPAHSIGDVFGQQVEPGADVRSACSDRLVLEAFDADGWTRARAAEWRDDLAEIIEHGSYLDASDVGPFLDLPFPGMDEVAAGPS
jgi:arsenite-transporting ATPase